MAESINLLELDIHKHKININGGLGIIHIGNGGGTGGILTSNILKTLGALTDAEKDLVSYIGIDGDVFEPKNLGRQLCLPCDLSKNKAQVLVSRYSKAYGLSDKVANYIDKYIESEDEVYDLIKSFNGRTVLIIDTVDKNKPRLDILNAINKRRKDGCNNGRIYSISCGNGEWAGQTVFGAKIWTSKEDAGLRPNTNIMSEPYTFSIPLAFERFPELIDLAEDAADEAMSCADRAIANAQAFVANNMGATFALNYFVAMIQEYKRYMNTDSDRVLASSEQTIGTCRFNALMNSVENYRLDTDYLLNRGAK